MLFKPRSTDAKSPETFVRPRVMPDPDQAAQLQRKMQALNYHPANGFHRDTRQSRQLRLVPRAMR